MIQELTMMQELTKQCLDTVLKLGDSVNVRKREGCEISEQVTNQISEDVLERLVTTDIIYICFQDAEEHAPSFFVRVMRGPGRSVP